MIEIIDFNDNQFLQLINDNRSIETNNCYITSISLISKLINENKFPIKNKNIAIENILNFLSFIDVELKKNNSTILPIPRIILEKYFSRNTYKEYMDYLSNNEIITKVPYEDGKFYDFTTEGDKVGRCIQYRIHNNYINNDLCLVIMPEKTKTKLEKDINYEGKLEKTILKTQINYRAAILAEIKHFKDNYEDLFINETKRNEGINSLRIRVSAILSLKRRRFIKKGKNVDRVYHSFSSLSRISRPYLNNNGKGFHDLDIKNCQPLLLCYYMKSIDSPIDDNYLEICENGLFYESLMDEDNLKVLINNYPQKGNEYDIKYKEYREEIKLECYKYIYFNFNKKKDIVKRFANLYPNTYYFLDNFYKMINDKTMASILQNIEAAIFNNIIPTKSKYYFTLFDAIYFSDYEDSYSIEQEIETKFSMLGIKPKIKKTI